MPVVAIAGDDAVLAHRHRALQPDGYRFLADVEVAEAADQAQAIKLSGPLFEAADEQHFAVKLEELVLVRLEALRLRRTFGLRVLLRRGSGFLGSSRHGQSLSN